MCDAEWAGTGGPLGSISWTPETVTHLTDLLNLFAAIVQTVVLLGLKNPTVRLVCLVRNPNMGLGPPVCEKCQVVGDLGREFNNFLWKCPICGNTEMEWSAWSCGLTDTELENNLRLLTFMKKAENGL